MKKYISYFIIVALTILSIEQCSKNSSNTNRYNSNINAYKDSTIHFKNRLGQEVASKLSLQLTEKELNNQLKDKSQENIRLKESLRKIKKPIVVIQSDQDVLIDTIYVPLKNNNYDYKFSFGESIKKEWFSFNVKGNEKGLRISDFELKNNQTLVFGWKKKSIFSTPQLKAEITNTNPYFNQKNIKPIYITYKRSWYEKPIYTVPLGFALGIASSKF